MEKLELRQTQSPLQPVAPPSPVVPVAAATPTPAAGQQGQNGPVAPAKAAASDGPAKKNPGEPNADSMMDAMDAPPWEDDFIPPPPPDIDNDPLSKPGPNKQTATASPAPASQPAPTPQPKAAPAPATPPISAKPTVVPTETIAAQSGLSPDDENPDNLWNAVLEAIRAQNVMVHMMAKNGVAQQIQEGTLVVGFPEGDEVQFNSVSAAINFNRLQGILQQLRPGMQLRFTKVHLTPASDAVTQRAKALFGDKLIIE